MTSLNLSARVYHRILKLAHTIVDLAGCEEIQSVHLAEALQNRPKSLLGKALIILVYTIALVEQILPVSGCKFALSYNTYAVSSSPDIVLP